MGGGRVGWITHLVPLLKVKYVCEGPGPGPDVKQHGFIHNESSETKEHQVSGWLVDPICIM